MLGDYIMTSTERILNAAKGRKTDVVPVAPYGGNFGAALVGVPLSEYCTNGRVMAEVQLRAWEQTQIDVVTPQSDGYYIAEGFGVKIEIPENSTPNVVKTAIDSLDEIENLVVPDPLSDGRMAVYLDATRILREKVGGEVAIRGVVTGPFSLAGHILGVENFLVELAMADIDEDLKKQEQLTALMNIAADAVIRFQKAAIDAGTDFVAVGDSMASPDLSSPQIYEKYIFPAEQRVFKEISEYCKDRELAKLLHICGNTKGILKRMSETGADILEIDYKVRMAEARAIVGNSVTLMGNIDPSSVLLSGTAEKVREDCLACIDEAGKDGRFILGSGCEVAMKTPLDNIREMVRVARAHKY